MPCLPEETPLVVRRNGVRLYGCRLAQGSDRIGVFIHGFRSDSGGSKSLALAEHAQARGYDWARLDLSGHGRSDGEFADFRLSTLLADVVALVDALAPQPLILVGSSMGGWLATLAALRYPARIHGLVLIAPAYNFLQRIFGALPLEELMRWQTDGQHRFASAYGDDFELGYAVLADAQQFDLLSAPVKLDCPVEIIHGERDEAVPLWVSERFLENLDAPAKALHVIPGGDHRLNSGIPDICVAVDHLWST